MHGTRLGLIMLTGLVMSGCGVSEPLEDVRVGVLREVEDTAVVTVPATARVGEPFEVTVTTVGGGCVRKGDTEVSLEGDTVTVIPYNRYMIPRPGVGCLEVESYLDHVASVEFSAPGDAVVIVRGRDPDTDQVMDLEYTVTVVQQ